MVFYPHKGGKDCYFVLFYLINTLKFAKKQLSAFKLEEPGFLKK